MRYKRVLNKNNNPEIKIQITIFSTAKSSNPKVPEYQINPNSEKLITRFSPIQSIATTIKDPPATTPRQSPPITTNKITGKIRQAPSLTTKSTKLNHRRNPLITTYPITSQTHQSQQTQSPENLTNRIKQNQQPNPQSQTHHRPNP